MRYFLDTEFWEHPRPGGASGKIDLISIGVVAEDGREFYAENASFPWTTLEWRADTYDGTERWLMTNVKPHLLGGHSIMAPTVIRDHILEFVSARDGSETVNDDKPEFWAYFADYDWVIFCWLFGRMIDLPKHFPMYCRDLKQEMDRLGIKRGDLPPGDGLHLAINDARWVRDAYHGLGAAYRA